MAGGHNKRGRQGFGVLLPKEDEHNLGGTEVDVLSMAGGRDVGQESSKTGG